jgi:hypothetical protein
VAPQWARLSLFSQPISCWYPFGAEVTPLPGDLQSGTLSAGASSAYLAVSEIFLMETRAQAIAFYALGTGLGGIIGPMRCPRWSGLVSGLLTAPWRRYAHRVGFALVGCLDRSDRFTVQFVQPRRGVLAGPVAADPAEEHRFQSLAIG